MKNRLVRRIVSLSVIDKYVVKKQKDLATAGSFIKSKYQSFTVKALNASRTVRTGTISNSFLRSLDRDL